MGTAQNDGWNLRQHFIDVVGRGCKRKRRVKIVSLRHFNLGNYGATPQPLAESHHRTTQTSNHRQHQFCQYIWKFVCAARRAQIHIIHIKATCCAKEKDIHCERNEERHENERDFWRENNSSYHYVHHLFHSGFLFSCVFFLWSTFAACRYVLKSHTTFSTFRVLAVHRLSFALIFFNLQCARWKRKASVKLN